MRFASLGSGSAGNATVIEAGETRLLLDCGFSVKETVLRLNRLGLEAEQLTGIVITHEHDDHAEGAFKLAARFKLPLWLTYGTYRMCDRYLPNNHPLEVHEIDAHTAFSIQDIEVMPFPVPHDAREPAQYVFSDGANHLGVLTDVGSLTPHITTMLSLCNALILECNHDLDMLHKGPYAQSLKKRVSGSLGHLDNQTSAQLLAQLPHTRFKHIVAAHLSETNNTSELAQFALSQVMGCAPDHIGVATQREGLDWRVLE